MNIAILNLPFEVSHALGDPSQWRLHMFAFLCAVDNVENPVICEEKIGKGKKNKLPSTGCSLTRLEEHIRISCSSQETCFFNRFGCKE